MAIRKKRLVCLGGILGPSYIFPRTFPSDIRQLTGIPWGMEARDRYEFFAVYRTGDGSIEKFASGK